MAPPALPLEAFRAGLMPLRSGPCACARPLFAAIVTTFELRTTKTPWFSTNSRLRINKVPRWM
jgi:hypothetical protein